MATNLLVYPADRPKYYLQFDIHNYSRNSLQEVGTLGPALKTIVLPLSANLTDLTSEKWDDNFQVGQLTGAAIDNIVIPTINSIRDLTGGIGNRAGSIAATATPQDAAKAALGSISGGASALLGFAPNQFLTVLFVSPMYKRHHFTWAVSPDTKAESDTLRKIGNAFKNAMSPKAAFVIRAANGIKITAAVPLPGRFSEIGFSKWKRLDFGYSGSLRPATPQTQAARFSRRSQACAIMALSAPALGRPAKSPFPSCT